MIADLTTSKSIEQIASFVEYHAREYFGHLETCLELTTSRGTWHPNELKSPNNQLPSDIQVVELFETLSDMEILHHIPLSRFHSYIDLYSGSDLKMRAKIFDKQVLEDIFSGVNAEERSYLVEIENHGEVDAQWTDDFTQYLRGKLEAFTSEEPWKVVSVRDV